MYSKSSTEINSLAVPNLIEYLLSKPDVLGEKMKGTIRPISRQRRCPKCNEPFKHIKKIGYICPGCKTVPNRYYIDLYWNGSRPQICSDKQGQPLDSYQRALNLLALIQHDIDNKSFDPSKYISGEQKNFWASALLDRFFADKKKQIAPSHLKTYEKLVSRHKEFWKNTDVRDIRKAQLKDYLEWLESSQELKSKSVKNNLDHFKTFLYWLKKELEIIDIVPSFPLVEVEEYKYTWFNPEEQINVLELVEDVDKPIIAFLMLHGCRPGEARALKVKHVDIRRQSVTISSTFSGTVIREKRKGRGARSVEIPIHPEMLFYFEEKVRNHPEAFIFPNPRTEGHPYSETSFKRIWDNVRKKGNLPKGVRCYDATRHSLGSQLANSGESVFVISKILGHSSLKMTEKYMHKDLESLRSTLSKLSLKKNNVIKLPVMRER